MQNTDSFLKGITICRTIEAFQGVILFNGERKKSKSKFLCNMPVIANHG